jgi:hypothetical protein
VEINVEVHVEHPMLRRLMLSTRDISMSMQPSTIQFATVSLNVDLNGRTTLPPVETSAKDDISQRVPLTRSCVVAEIEESTMNKHVVLWLS